MTLLFLICFLCYLFQFVKGVFILAHQLLRFVHENYMYIICKVSFVNNKKTCYLLCLQAVSVCRSGDANVWDVAKGKQLKRFNWGTDMKPKYRFRSCW